MNRRCKQNISIHAPREGDDAFASVNGIFVTVFQSTPPARGTTEMGILAAGAAPISIHAPREGDDEVLKQETAQHIAISIHAPREGDDSKDAQFYLRIFDK